MGAVQHTYVIYRQYQNGGEWFEESRFNDEADAVLSLQQLENAYPFDEFQIADDYE